MTRSAVVYTTQEGAQEAGRDLGSQIAKAFDGQSPDAVIIFASAKYEYQTLLRTLSDTCHPRALVGSSSAGEFISGHRGAGVTCAIALGSTHMQFTMGLGRDLSADPAACARQVVSSFRGLSQHAFPYRSALVMTDALAGYAEVLTDELTVLTSGTYQFFGGGAGDDGRFQRTHVFHGTEAISNAVVALEILSEKPLGIGVSHGWEPAGAGMRVTDADGFRLISLNGMPAAEAFEEHAAQTGQTLDRAAPLPFFLHNILGIDTPHGAKLRVPLSVAADGSVACAAEIPTGSVVHMMRTTSGSAIEAATTAARSAMSALAGNKAHTALFFDCVATRLRMGDAFGAELDSLAATLGDASFAGCNTYGQIARASGQFGGFHNCTAVVCVLPE
jgi:hypothetical protein